MAAGTFTLFNAFKEKLGNALIDLDTASVADHAVFADTSNELATANGYTAGGVVLTVAWTRSAGTCSFTCDPVSWLVSGSGITARVAVVHADLSVSDKPLVGHLLLEIGNSDVAVTAGNALTITPHPKGLFTLT
jgi:hypothetical protein